MKNELIKYWGKKCFFWISMLWLFSQIMFVIIAGILINSVDDKLINILIIVGINSLMLLILFGFSVSIYTYETVYQREHRFVKKNVLLLFMIIRKVDKSGSANQGTNFTTKNKIK